MQTKIHHHALVLVICILCVLSRALEAAGKGPNPLILGCGSTSEGKDADGRKWEPDTKYLVNADKSSNTAKAQNQDPSLPSPVPYMNARTFTSDTTYQFPLQDSTSRTLLRFYFYPASYPNLNVSNSYFSVTAGKYTLLNNFSASITAQALSQAYIVKEYILAPSDSSNLNITFKPSNQSFAFVNGIEVIPTPKLFDNDPPMVGSAVQDTSTSLGSSDQTVSLGDLSMETMFRINVGGQYISPNNDSAGLARSWYDDSPYVYGSAFGVSFDANVTINYGGLPSYTAPLDVYRTVRSMGSESKVNMNFNLSWVFRVDANFSYLVRFHWCDWQMDKVNQRVFQVLLNNKTAEAQADIFGWTRKRAAPMAKDYVIYVNDKPGDDELWVVLHPVDSSKPQYIDSLLNGLEIFKLSDGKSNLAGPNPAISDLMNKYLKEADNQPKPTSEQGKKTYTVAIISGAGAAAFGVAVAIVFMFAQKRKIRPTDGTTSWLPIYGNSHSSGSKSNSGKSHGSTNISSDAACNCRYFSLAEIKQATKNFDESNVIGVGGFGKVYKGVIDGETLVAIKRSNPSSEQGVNEFQTEIEMLSKLRHRHLVSLIGFCEENNEMVLVYDYMGKGTLREHLYKGNKTTLSWKQRLEICIGAARGLHYLHTGAKYTIIHRDVKTTNILLDDKWVAKVSDFGLSKTGPTMNQGHVSTVVKGSFGYLDPEYFRRQQLTEKSDVYSFGVVLFEVLCARPALNPSLPKEQVSLADWVLHCRRKGNLEDIIDPQVKGKIPQECLNKFAETAEKCLADHGVDRPSMGDVLWNLEYALQLLENPDASTRSVSRSQETMRDVQDIEAMDQQNMIALHRSTLSLGSESDDTNEDTNENSQDNTNEIFSQLVNPKGR